MYNGPLTFNRSFQAVYVVYHIAISLIRLRHNSEQAHLASSLNIEMQSEDDVHCPRWDIGGKVQNIDCYVS